MVYEWKPTKCTHCGMFGHQEAECKKKAKISSTQVWRKKVSQPEQQAQQNDTIQTQQQNHSKDPMIDEFTPVASKSSSRRAIRSKELQPHVTNSFEILEFLQNEELDQQGELSAGNKSGESHGQFSRVEH